MLLNNQSKYIKFLSIFAGVLFSLILSINSSSSFYESIYLFGELSIIISGLILLGAFDFSSKKIPNNITILLFIASLLFVGIDYKQSQLSLNIESLLVHLLGAVLGFTIFLIVYLIPKQVLGGGDVKLAGLIGLIVGFPMVILVLLGGLLISMLSLVIKNSTNQIPLGFYLVITTIVYIGIFNIFFQ